MWVRVIATIAAIMKLGGANSPTEIKLRPSLCFSGLSKTVGDCRLRPSRVIKPSLAPPKQIVCCQLRVSWYRSDRGRHCRRATVYVPPCLNMTSFTKPEVHNVGLSQSDCVSERRAVYLRQMRFVLTTAHCRLLPRDTVIARCMLWLFFPSSVRLSVRLSQVGVRSND